MSIQAEQEPQWFVLLVWLKTNGAFVYSSPRKNHEPLFLLSNNVFFPRQPSPAWVAISISGLGAESVIALYLKSKSLSVIIDLIRTIKDSGKTLIFSTHQLNEVRDIADHIVVMKAGEKIFDGDNDAFQALDSSKNFTEIFMELVNE